MQEAEYRDGLILREIYQYCLYVQELLDEFGIDEDLFYTKRAFRDSVSMNVLCIGECAGKLSENYRKHTGDKIPWQAIRAMRNRFAHNYGGMDTKMIWDTVIHEVPKLKAFCEAELPLLAMEDVPTDEIEL